MTPVMFFPLPHPLLLTFNATISNPAPVLFTVNHPALWELAKLVTENTQEIFNFLFCFLQCCICDLGHEYKCIAGINIWSSKFSSAFICLDISAAVTRRIWYRRSSTGVSIKVSKHLMFYSCTCMSYLVFLVQIKERFWNDCWKTEFFESLLSVRELRVS